MIVLRTFRDYFWAMVAHSQSSPQLYIVLIYVSKPYSAKVQQKYIFTWRTRYTAIRWTQNMSTSAICGHVTGYDNRAPRPVLLHIAVMWSNHRVSIFETTSNAARRSKLLLYNMLFSWMHNHIQNINLYILKIWPDCSCS